MVFALRWTLAVAVGACLLACDSGLPFQRSIAGCPAGFETCDGTNDCFSGCVCEGATPDSCATRCGVERGDYVSDLDEEAWVQSWIDFEDEVIDRTNALRAQGGCCDDEGCFEPSDPLRFNERLRSSARAHARDMAEHDYFDHDSRDGRSPFDRMREAGFKGCGMGENIALGQRTPEAVVMAWRESPGHCRNMLDPAFEEIGVGFYERQGTRAQQLWAQNFGD